PPESLPQGLQFVGLLAFEDPLREGVAEAIHEAGKAGIRVVMLTGDSPETAGAIAAKLKMPTQKIALGAMLDDDQEDIGQLAKEVSVFARMSPEHKLKLVKAWSDQGEVVGMT